MPLSDRVLEPTTVEVLAAHDVVFLGLPHGQSAEIARALPDSNVVIDCGADFRLADPVAGIGPSGSYADLSPTVYWILAAAMLLGRLEFFTVLVLLMPRFWKG